MNSSPSIAGRAVLAVVLMIGFYLLALAMAGGLLWLVYAEAVYDEMVHPKLALFCILGALAILWSVLPRFDAFPAPGPQLTREEHPRLFAEIESIAQSTGQAPPAEVFLVHDVNAWVAQRGGRMGFGSRRVMGLGLPLLRTLSRSQFRAVLAHEFGHFHSGDTRLGPWIYKTRGAIDRTLATLSGDNGKGALLQLPLLGLPFLGYAKMFLRITHAVSRRQEFIADALAARAVGSKPLIEGLRTVHGVAPAFNAYWHKECAPVLGAGFRPPLADGFAQFLQTGAIADAIKQNLDAELADAKTNPYDTHPPLKERIAAVARLPAGDVPEGEPAALSLLEDVPALEKRMLAAMAGEEKAGTLQAVTWTDVCERVYLPQWRELVQANAAPLSALKPESLPALAQDLKSLGRQCVFNSGEPVGEEHAESMAAAVAGSALAVLLVDRGGVLDSPPGQPVFVRLGEATLEPFNVLPSLASGKITAEAWQQQCAALTLSGAPLASAPAETV